MNFLDFSNCFARGASKLARTSILQVAVTRTGYGYSLAKVRVRVALACTRQNPCTRANAHTLEQPPGLRVWIGERVTISLLCTGAGFSSTSKLLVALALLPFGIDT